PLVGPRERQARMGARIASIERERLLEETPRLGIRLERAPAEQREAPHGQAVGGEGAGWPSPRLSQGSVLDARGEARGDAADHLAAYAQEIRLVGLDPLGPELPAGGALDQARADAKPLAGATEPATQQMARAQALAGIAVAKIRDGGGR